MQKWFLVLSLFVLSTTTTVWAQDVKIGDIAIIHPWARETPPVAQVGGGFVTLHNTGDQDDRLLGAAADIAERVELHTHIMQNGVMMMRQVQFIDLPANTKVRLEPGGLHIMFIGLKAPLQAGQAFPLALEFQQAGQLVFEMIVEKTL